MYDQFRPDWYSFVNNQVEISKRKVIDSNNLIDEIHIEYIYILWKKIDKIERIKINYFVILEDGTEVYEINGKKLIILLPEIWKKHTFFTTNRQDDGIPQCKLDTDYKLTYDNKTLSICISSDKLNNYILNDN